MKKVIPVLIALLMLLSITACGSSSKDVFDKISSLMGKNYSTKEEVDTAIRKALGEPLTSNDVTYYVYQNYDLYGYAGNLDVKVDPYYNIEYLDRSYYTKDADKDEFGTMVSSIIQKLDDKYGRHNTENSGSIDDNRYSWKDGKGVEVTMFAGKTESNRTRVFIIMMESND